MIDSGTDKKPRTFVSASIQPLTNGRGSSFFLSGFFFPYHAALDNLV